MDVTNAAETANSYISFDSSTLNSSDLYNRMCTEWSSATFLHKFSFRECSATVLEAKI